MADHPLRPATRLRLGRPLPYQLADGPQAHPLAPAFVKRPALTSSSFEDVVSCCISAPFGTLSTTWGQITYVLLTRAPLYRGRSPFSLDLHVLSAPLTFVLSQDQTLQLNPALSIVNSSGRTTRLRIARCDVSAVPLRCPGCPEPHPSRALRCYAKALPRLLNFFSPPVTGRT